MAYQRIKKITEEERAARSTLKKMGVSEYELNRLYDANYKARQRGEIAGAAYGESLNLNWKNVLMGARQAAKKGKTASEYIRDKASSFKGKYQLKQVKKSEIMYIVSVGEITDWGTELVKKELKKYSTTEVVKFKTDAIQEMEAAGVAPKNEPTSEVYRRSHQRYIEENASTEAEWKRILAEETGKEQGLDEILLEYVARAMGIDIDGVRAAQKVAEDEAKTLQGEAKERFLRRRKKEAFEIYKGV